MLRLVVWKSQNQEMLKEPPAAITQKHLAHLHEKIDNYHPKNGDYKKEYDYTKYKKFDLTKLRRKDQKFPQK